MNRNCERIRPTLSAYLDGELPRGETRSVGEHLALCKNCQEELELLTNARTSLHEIEALPEVPEAWHQLRSRLGWNASKSFVFDLLRPRWIAAAACVTAVLLLGIMFWPSSSNRTDIDPYLGLYLLAGNASDVLSSQVSAQEIRTAELNFPVYNPSAVGSSNRKGIYLHKLHGQPVVQIFYAGQDRDYYCIFQQAANHSLDFGKRDTQQEFVRNQICTKFASQHFDLMSWSSGKTRFTVITTSDAVDVKQTTADWIGLINAPTRPE